MTFSERGLERPFVPPEARTENTQDVLPLTERNQDPERSMHNLVNESARPLTDDERKAADRDTSNAGERVFAPASERVPKTVPDYRDVVSSTDPATPERQAAGQTQPSAASSSDTGRFPEANEPSFARASRPSDASSTVGSASGDIDSAWNNEQANRWMSNASGSSMLPFGLGWVGLGIFGVGLGIGGWLWMRWRRERNKPINRLRRQARQSASMARDRIPDMPEIPDEATRPALGLGTALLSVAVLLWQQSQARSRADEAKARAQKASGKASKKGRQALETVSDMDWQQRLMQLRDFWNANRIEMEKVSIPRR
jgi:hypothetical protein